MNDTEFLRWIYDRLKYIHGEDKRSDYMRRLNGIVERMELAEPCKTIEAETTNV